MSSAVVVDLIARRPDPAVLPALLAAIFGPEVAPDTGVPSPRAGAREYAA